MKETEVRIFRLQIGLLQDGVGENIELGLQGSGRSETILIARGRKGKELHKYRIYSFLIRGWPVYFIQTLVQRALGNQVAVLRPADVWITAIRYGKFRFEQGIGSRQDNWRVRGYAENPVAAFYIEKINRAFRRASRL